MPSRHTGLVLRRSVHDRLRGVNGKLQMRSDAARATVNGSGDLGRWLMLFTALHRHLGESPGAITDAMLDAAVLAELAEAHDLDWKSALPPASKLNETDFPKDVAAMANSGGGVIVYGVTEKDKKATGRNDTGNLTEIHERTLRAAAYSAISPPVVGLVIERVGEVGNQAVAIVVPDSHDGPHLIFRDKYFGAPLRNDADTEWMQERQIEASYRARAWRVGDAPSPRWRSCTTRQTRTGSFPVERG
jgi:hypothetical protein